MNWKAIAGILIIGVPIALVGQYTDTFQNMLIGVDLPTRSQPARVTPSNLSAFKERMGEADPDGRLIVGVADSGSPGEIEVTVSNAWHVQPKQVRLQMAQNLWEIWSAIASPQSPDTAKITIKDINGNRVGGSGVMGSLISVTP